MRTRDAARLLSAFGRTVRGLRGAQAISQEELAHRAGLHRTYVGAIERGERNVSLINIVRLADALSTDAALLLAGMDQEARTARRPE